MFKLFQLLMCIAITILRVNEVEGGCTLIHRSHSGSKSWGMELGAIQWEETMWLSRRFEGTEV
jgi:hypothetical protein